MAPSQPGLQPARGQHVAVIGAGVVGVACAASLVRDGHRVTLIDREEPARATSFGNAGAFAISDVVPLSEPGIFRRVPGWLMDPLGPLAIRWGYLPKLAPWMWRFLRAGSPRRMAHLTEAMSALLGRAYDDLIPLAEWAGITPQWRRHGSLTLYDSAADLARDEAKWRIKGQHGVRYEIVTGARLRELEPHVSERYQHAVHVPDWSHVDDPYLFTRDLANRALAAGVTLRQADVAGLDVAAGQVRGVRLADDTLIEADQVVVAAGVWSDKLAQQLGYRVPLESERGYHATLPNAGVDLTRFLLASSDGFVILPMGNGGIRVAGTVELAGREAPANWARAEVLVEKARRILPPFKTEGVSLWMGHRPALPDTLPVISRAPRHYNVQFAFGHGHLGLTLSATTGRLIADLVGDRANGFPLNAYRLDRF